MSWPSRPGRDRTPCKKYGRIGIESDCGLRLY